MSNDYSEILAAAEQAVTDLNALLMDVESSGNWKYYDIFGAGLANRIFKNRRIDRTAANVDKARSSVKGVAALIDAANVLPDGISKEDWIFARNFLELSAEEWVMPENLRECDDQARDAVRKAKALRDAIRAVIQ